jgi:putative ABC transport system permease protein
METVFQDTRYALRLLTRQRAFSIVTIGTIAVAMGLATALFSVIDAAVLRPLPFPKPEQIVAVEVGTDDHGRPHFTSASLADMRRWESAGVFSSVAAWNDLPLGGGIIHQPGPERVEIREATEGYLALHGVAPAEGRDFTTADTMPGAPPVVIVSHAYWQSRLGGDVRAIGRGLRYDSVSATVVGVMPAGFYPDVPLWRPLRMDAARADRRGTSATVYGRLKADVARADAEQRLSAMTPGVRLGSVLDSVVANYERTVTVLAAAVGLIAFIACVNVVGLLLARGAARQTELAIRGSLGAGRLRLIRQLLTESVVVSLAGGAIGAFIAWLSLNGLVTILPITFTPGSGPELNLPVLAACAAFALATGLVCGLVPALRLSRAVTGATARGARPDGSALSRRAGQSLIGAEVALAVVLVVAAGLMIRSFARLTSVDMGFDPATVVAFKAAPVATDAAVHARYFPDLLRAIQALPGIEAAGAVDHFALGETSIVRSVAVRGESVSLGIRQVLPGYFEAMGIPLRQGRLPSFENGDAAGTWAIINESAARRLFPDGASGGELTVGGRRLSVLGVAADVRHGGPGATHRPEVFIPYQPPTSPPQRALGMTVVVRPTTATANLAHDLRGVAERIGPSAVIEEARSGRTWLSDRVATPRHRTALLGVLGAVGLALALVGIFSMTAFAVVRRTREIGVRMALGARPADIVGRMLWDAGWPSLCGIGAGLGASYYATRIVQHFLFETTAHDPATLSAVALLMAIVTLVAAWIPARRAASVDPVATLKAE